MRVEAGVFCRQDRIFHDFGDGGDGRQCATFFPKLANQYALGRKNAQRQFGPVIRQIGNIRQVGIGHCQGNCKDEQQRQRTGGCHTRAPKEEAQQPGQPGRALGRGVFGRTSRSWA